VVNLGVISVICVRPTAAAVYFRNMKAVLLFALAVFFSVSGLAQPKRKATIGAKGSWFAGGWVVDSVYRDGTFASLGIRKNDTVLQLNDKNVSDEAAFNSIIGNLRAGDPLSVTFKRGRKKLVKKGNAVMRPFETSSLADVIYGWGPHGNCTLRTIVRRPKLQGKLPAVLLIPGYNCGSIENYNQGSYGALINSWLQNGFAVVTIEKSGLGDSYNCQPCMETDLVNDIQVFDAGYRFMEQLPFVDNQNLFIWGHSMGGIIAPEVARHHAPRGVIVFATVFRPWSEFLLEMHRVQYPLDGKSYVETERDVRMMQKIYYEFFRLKKSPAAIHSIPEYREMAERELEFKTPENTNMWGRHWRFWQQIDSLDMAASWTAVKAPVLSVFGGADFIACSLLEHQLIVRTVNAAFPGNATHITIPDVDHLLVQNPDWKAAHANFMNRAYRDQHFHQGFADTVNKWMKERLLNR